MALTKQQQRNEDLARIDLENGGWLVNYVHPAEDADPLLGKSAKPREACVAKSFKSPGGQVGRKVITGPSLQFCLQEAIGHEDRLARLKEDQRPLGITEAEAAVPVTVDHPGDTEQQKRAPNRSLIASVLSNPGRGPGQ
jgi:hypothetical protein